MEHAAGTGCGISAPYAPPSEVESEILSAIYGQGALPDYYTSVTAGNPPGYEDTIEHERYCDDPRYEEAILKSMLHFTVNDKKKTE